VSAICALALVSGLSWALPGTQATLAWTHSVERTEWRETYIAEPGRLRLIEARVQSSGAGMDPGPGAIYEKGWWVWRPLPGFEVERLSLARSSFVDDYELCIDRTCRPLAIWLPGLRPNEDVELSSC
jgi:hypothetical protein